MEIYVIGCSLTQINDGQRLPPVLIDIITDLVSTLFRTYDSAKYGGMEMVLHSQLLCSLSALHHFWNRLTTVNHHTPETNK
jgi:hypothetical protein